MKAIKMSREEFLKEHKTLIRELRHPKTEVLKREARKQSAEVRERVGKKR